MTSKRISVDLEESLCRRFKARLAYLGTAMTTVLGDLVSKWVGTWGEQYVTHTVAVAEDLRQIAAQHYGDPELY